MTEEPLERIAIALERTATALERIAVNVATCRGRSAAVIKAVTPVTVAAGALDDFLGATPAPKPATVEQVRAALQAYGKRHGGIDKAQQLMKNLTGALRLAVASDVPGGDQGILGAKDYNRLIEAAKA